MNIRLGHEKEVPRRYVHMLSATLCSTERTLCCLLEMHQTERGITVHKVLRPYMGGVEFIPFAHSHK